MTTHVTTAAGGATAFGLFGSRRAPIARAVGPARTPAVAPAVKAIADTMLGIDPHPADVAALARHQMSARMLHLGAAAALTRSLPPGDQGGDDRIVAEQARELATALAEAQDGAPRQLDHVLRRGDWFPAAQAVSALQLRFLATVCAQTQIEPDSLLKRLGAAASEIAESHTRPADGISQRTAFTSISVAGVRYGAVTDGGPSILDPEEAALFAAPYEVIPSTGRWDASTVNGCLALIGPEYARWAARRPRDPALQGNVRGIASGGERRAPRLDRFILPPAATAIRASPAFKMPPVGDAGPIPLREAGPDKWADPREEVRQAVLAQTRGSGKGMRLAPIPQLPDPVPVNNLRASEEHLLSAFRATTLDEPVTVTVNLDLSDEVDHQALATRWRETGIVAATQQLIGWVGQDAVSGPSRRMSLVVHTQNGIPFASGGRQGLALPAGTSFSVIYTEVSRYHAVLHLVERKLVGRLNDAASRSDRSKSGHRLTSLRMLQSD